MASVQAARPSAFALPAGDDLALAAGPIAGQVFGQSPVSLQRRLAFR